MTVQQPLWGGGAHLLLQGSCLIVLMQNGFKTCIYPMLMKVPFVFDAFDGAEYSFEREASWCNRNSLWSCSRLLSKPKYLST